MKTTAFVWLCIAVSSAAAADDRDYDKRLARSMQLYRMETGLDSPEVREAMSAKDKELQVSRAAMVVAESEAAAAAGERDAAVKEMEAQRESHQRLMKEMQDEMASTLQQMSGILQEQRKAEGDPELTKTERRNQLLAGRRGSDGGVSDPAIDAQLPEFVLRKGTLEENFSRILAELDFRLVWNAPRYLVEHDFTVKAPDMFAAIEQVMHAYEQKGIPLEAHVFAKNLTVEIVLGQWKQQLSGPVGEGVSR